MNAKEIVSAAQTEAVVYFFTRLYHKWNWCSCHNLVMGYVDPCQVGKEELLERRRQELFRQWDGLGLGYVGPKL